MTTNEHKLARALVEAHVAPEVMPVVLEAVDGWADVVARAKEALEQQARTADDLSRYYTVKELRLLLKMSDSGVRSLLDSGVLPETRVGGSIRVAIADVNRYLAENTSRHEPVSRQQRSRRSPQDEDMIRKYPFLND